MGGYIFLQSTGPQIYTFQWFLIFIISLTLYAPILYEYISTGQVDPFSPIVWAIGAFTFIYILPAGARLINDNFSVSSETISVVNPQILTEVLFWIWIASIFMIIGYYWERKYKIERRIPKLKNSWHVSRVTISVFICILIGVLGYYLLLSEIGTGPRSSYAEGSNVPAFIAVNFLNIGSAILITHVYKSELSYNAYRIKIRRFLYIFISFSMVLFNTYILYSLGGRGRAFGSFIILLHLFHYLFRSFGFISGFGVYVLIRGFGGWLAKIMANIISLDIVDLFNILTNPTVNIGGERGYLNNLLVFFEGFPEMINIQFGGTFLNPLNKILPVRVHPQTSWLYNEAFNPSVVGEFGFPIGLVGDLYLNFWIFGIPLGFLMVGVAMRIVYNWGIVENPTTGSIVFYCILSNSFPYATHVDTYVTSIIGLIVLPSVLVLLYVCDGVETKGD